MAASSLSRRRIISVSLPRRLKVAATLSPHRPRPVTQSLLEHQHVTREPHHDITRLYTRLSCSVQLGRSSTRSTVSVTNNEQTERTDVLFMEHVRVDSRKQFISVRVISMWNEIPDVIKTQKTVNAFKNRYDEWKSTEMGRQQQQTETPDARRS